VSCEPVLRELSQGVGSRAFSADGLNVNQDSGLSCSDRAPVYTRATAGPVFSRVPR
jgi:hypothetical protein